MREIQEDELTSIDPKKPIKVTGIKCDKPECNFREDDISLGDFEEWLERPCPECGTILLTEEDLKFVKTLGALTAIANQLKDDNED